MNSKIFAILAILAFKSTGGEMTLRWYLALLLIGAALTSFLCILINLAFPGSILGVSIILSVITALGALLIYIGRENQQDWRDWVSILFGGLLGAAMNALAVVYL